MVDNNLIILFIEKIKENKLNLNKRQCIFMAYLVEHMQKNKQRISTIGELKKELELYLGKTIYYSQMYYGLQKLYEIGIVELDDFRYDISMNDICMDSKTEVKLLI
jgi:hypothetical protein